MPIPTCLSHFLTDSSPLDSSKYVLDLCLSLLARTAYLHPLSLPPSPVDMDAVTGLSLSVHLKDLQQSPSVVYLNYMAVEYNVSFPQAARE